MNVKRVATNLIVAGVIATIGWYVVRPHVIGNLEGDLAQDITVLDRAIEKAKGFDRVFSGYELSDFLKALGATDLPLITGNEEIGYVFRRALGKEKITISLDGREVLETNRNRVQDYLDNS